MQLSITSDEQCRIVLREIHLLSFPIMLIIAVIIRYLFFFSFLSGTDDNHHVRGTNGGCIIVSERKIMAVYPEEEAELNPDDEGTLR